MDSKPPESITLFDRLSVFFATGCYAGVAPARLLQMFPQRETSDKLRVKKWTGAGLLGSIEGVLTYLILPVSIAQSWIAVAAAILVSVAFSHRAERVLQSHDDARIIIDEWAGAWVAVWGLSHKLCWPVAVAFAFFRVFDVVKGPVGRRLQNLPGGWGVTMDDVFAGILANVVARISVELFPLYL